MHEVEAKSVSPENTKTLVVGVPVLTGLTRSTMDSDFPELAVSFI